MDFGEEGLDAAQSFHEVDGIDAGVTEVGDVAEIIGRDMGLRIDAAHEARHVADFPRTVPGAGPIGGAAVPGNAD